MIRTPIDEQAPYPQSRVQDRGGDHFSDDKPITINSLEVQAEISTPIFTRLARSVDDPKTASALLLDLAGRIVSVLDCGIQDLFEFFLNIYFWQDISRQTIWTT